MYLRWKPFFQADSDAEPSGGGSPSDRAPRGSELLERFGSDAIKIAEKLAEALSDNYSQRDKLREMRARIRDLEARQLPDNQVVLSAEEAQRWQAYQALGTPDALQQRLDQATQTTRSLLLRQAANVAGLDADKLARLLPADVEIRVEAAGADPQAQPARALVVRDGQSIALRDDAAVAPFLAALDMRQSQGVRHPLEQPTQPGSADQVGSFLSRVNQQRQPEKSV